MEVQQRPTGLLSVATRLTPGQRIDLRLSAMKDPACTLLLMGKELSNRKMINQQDYDYLKGIYLRDVPATAEEIEDLKEYYLTKLKACCSWYATPDEARERILSLIIRLEHLNP